MYNPNGESNATVYLGAEEADIAPGNLGGIAARMLAGCTAEPRMT